VFCFFRIENEEIKKTKKKLLPEEEYCPSSLPRIEDLTISVPENECLEMGKITSIIDNLGEFIRCYIEQTPNPFANFGTENHHMISYGIETLWECQKTDILYCYFC
jgi:hypothetical protein